MNKVSKIYILFLYCLVLITIPSFCQVGPAANTATNSPVTTESWVDELYTAGVALNGDSVILSEEVQHLLNKTELYTFMYPEEYTWEVTLALVEKNQLKKAFWYMINLYSSSDKNKELVTKSILAYTSFLDMEKVLTNTFYTYCFMDPQIGTISDGKPTIFAPHLLEQKMHVVQELTSYVNSYKQSTDKG